MQVVESQSLILYQTDLRGQWPEEAARTFAAQLPYARRLAVRSGSCAARASLAGIALALRALALLLERKVSAGELVFAAGRKPCLAAAARAATEQSAAARAARATDDGLCQADFSISHSGHWVGCAAVARGRVGFDLEMGTDARRSEWVVHEAALKATGAGLQGMSELRGLELLDGRVRWQGELWYQQRLDGFPGASACVLSSLAVHAVHAHTLGLEELFAS